jgi:O-antigen ligase
MLGALAFFTALAAGIAMSAHGWNVDPFHRGEGALATFLVTAAPFMLLLAWRPPVGLNRGVRTWIVATLLLVLLVVTARMSENRVVWIAFAASFAVAMLLSPPTRARGRAVAGAGALLLVFGLLFTDAARERASHVRPGDTSVAATLSADPRLVIWKSASEHIRARPWLGYGYGLHILGREIGRDTGDAKVMHPHNLFASQWLQTGAIGAALFTIMLGAVAHRFVRFTRMKDVALARLGAIGLAVLVGFLIRNLTDDFFLRANGKLLFAACAILLGAGTLRRKELERASGGAAPAAAAAP